jgi:hypothetical protein
MFAVGLTGFLVTVASLVVWALFGRTETPWLLLIALAVASGLMVGSLGRRRSWSRVVTAAFGTLVTAGTWYALLVALAFPSYDGEVRVGAEVPEFRAHTAAGTVLDQQSLHSQQATLLIFYRGYW